MKTPYTSEVQRKLRMGHNRIAMEACEAIALACLANDFKWALHNIYEVVHYGEYAKIDSDVWYPLLIEALDLHHLRAANIMEWSPTKQIPYLGGPRNPDVVEIPVVMYHKMSPWAAS